VVPTALLATGACFSSEDPRSEVEPVSAVLAYDSPCELIDINGSSETVFGADSDVEWSEETTGEFSECRGHLVLMEEDEETGSIDFLVRLFDRDNLEPEGSHGGIGRFQLSGQAENDEILDWPIVQPIGPRWDGGETYMLDGMGLSRDVSIVGSWGKAEDFAVGVSFRFAAKSDFYDENLVYHQYCDTTDLASDCLISSETLYQWMDTEYLPALLERLSEVATG